MYGVSSSRVRCAVASLAFFVALISLPTMTRGEPMNGEFANISPMPGGGYAIAPDGEPDGFGAVQINIPVAYTTKSGYIVAGGYLGGETDHKSSFTNKTGIIGTSFGGYPRAWISGMIAGRRHTLACGQLSLIRDGSDLPRAAVGIQSFAKFPNMNRWFYGVATQSFQLGACPAVHVTVGVRGDRDSARGIAGVSVPLGGYFNVAGEWDGYQLNAGVAIRPSGRYGILTALGAYNGRVGWLAGLNISYKFWPRK